MAVREQQRFAVLRQARRLRIGRLLKTILVELDRKTARQQRRGGGQPGGIIALDRMDAIEIGVEPGAIERRLVELLRGADERARLIAHAVDHRIEIAATIGHQEQHELARALRHGQ